MSIEHNKSVLVRAVEQFSDPSQRQAYFDLYATNAILHGYPGVEPGIESIKRFYTAFWAAFPDASVTIDNLTGEEDRVACCFEIMGTYRRVPGHSSYRAASVGHEDYTPAFRGRSLRRTMESS